jgi:hypothetical protein
MEAAQFYFWEYISGNQRHLYCILNGPSFAVHIGSLAEKFVLQSEDIKRLTFKGI